MWFDETARILSRSLEFNSTFANQVLINCDEITQIGVSQNKKLTEINSQTFGSPKRYDLFYFWFKKMGSKFIISISNLDWKS